MNVRVSGGDFVCVRERGRYGGRGKGGRGKTPLPLKHTHTHTPSYTPTYMHIQTKKNTSLYTDAVLIPSH